MFRKLKNKFMISKTNTLLQVSNLNFSYGSKKILRDINFSIKDIVNSDLIQGQVVSLVSRSGIGKSTLLNLLSGILTIQSGKILVNENLQPVKAGDMGVVFQDYYIYEWRKVSKLFDFAVMKNLSVKENERKELIKYYADLFILNEHLDKFPCELSGGQKQRVAIVEQLLLGGNFILLDEPFSGLDVIMIDKVFATLQKVSTMDELKTIIIVSHDLSNTVALSDTVFVMNLEEGKEGATIIKEIDLIERDLAWHKDIKDNPKFRECLKEIKSLMA